MKSSLRSDARQRRSCIAQAFQFLWHLYTGGVAPYNYLSRVG